MKDVWKEAYDRASARNIELAMANGSYEYWLEIAAKHLQGSSDVICVSLAEQIYKVLQGMGGFTKGSAP